MMISSTLQYVCQRTQQLTNLRKKPSKVSVKRHTSSSLCLWILLLLVRTNGNNGAHAQDTVESIRSISKGQQERDKQQEQYREMQHHQSRQKRLLWITSDGRLALPPGTTLVINPSLSLPFVRYPPDGFASNMTIALPFTINFDQLGLTDNENPYGVPPPLLARSMGEEVGNILGQYVMRLLQHRRRRRSVDYQNKIKTEDKQSKYNSKSNQYEDRDNWFVPPKLPKQHEHAFHGGERALMYIVAEEFLDNFGMDGKACLLRAICEVHANRLHNFGVVGEIVKLFLTASKSPFAEFIPEHVEAENAGSGRSGSSECWQYLKDCPKSLFQSKHNMYSNEDQYASVNDITTNKNEELDKSEKVTYNPKLLNM